MASILEAVKIVGSALLDPWYLVDDQDRIIDFNAGFHALLPRPIARRLRGLHCREAAKLPPCLNGPCLREQCQKEGTVRMDELEAEVGGETLRLILSATPVDLGEGKTGSLIVLRNVTDDAKVQSRYQELIRQAEVQRAVLEQQLQQRTRELLAANEELNQLDEQIAGLRSRTLREG